MVTCLSERKLFPSELFQTFSVLPCAVKLLIPWAEVTGLERATFGLINDAIRVRTRQKQREFSMFLDVDEVMTVMTQLGDMVLRRLFDNGQMEPDSNITKR